MKAEGSEKGQPGGDRVFREAETAGEDPAGRLLDPILDHLKRERRIDLGGYRRATLRHRLATRLEHVGISDPSEYMTRVEADSAECDALIGVLVVNVTSFFRDPILFEILAQSVLPRIVETAARGSTREIRVWSAGCATGEEAYSIAIAIHTALKNAPDGLRPLVFATDINEESLEAARRGLYSRDKLENTKLGVLDRYFLRQEDRYKIRPEIQSIVRFSRQTLTSPDLLCPTESVFAAFDLVLCRNVLIYFSRELQESVLDRLSRCLGPAGYLILGSAEFLSGPASKRLRAVDGRNRIFQRT